MLQTTTAISLRENKFDQIVSSVGYSAKELIEKPPIAMLKQVDGMSNKIEAFIAIQLVKLMEAVNINGNLNMQSYQIPIIAAQLVEMYPVESLEDFVLCFKRGGAGFYGTIYKLDASVICEWMKQYLDEKYTYVEAKVAEEKEQLKTDNEVNYAKFKERVGDFITPEKQTNFKENDYQRWKLENQREKFYIRGIEIWARTYEDAEKILRRMIDLGQVEEVNIKK